MKSISKKDPIAAVDRIEKPKSVVDRISYVEALRVLLSAEAGNPYPDGVRAELPAIISHWLQSPQKDALVVGAGAAARWREILAAYVRADKAGAWLGTTPKRRAHIGVDFSDVAFPPSARPAFTFIDLFAGIGGFRIALQSFQGKCVFSSEWDSHAKQTYLSNYGEVPFGDIREFTGDKIPDAYIEANIPDHDILAGGFPCQPFSRAGVSARSSLGQSHGFSCEIQGTLFFDLMRIARVKRPKVLFLENVKNLARHDGGRTFERIRTTIEHELGYSFEYGVIDSSPLVPQRRKRCYIVCFRDKRKFKLPEIAGDPLPLSSILEVDPPESFTLSDRMWQGHINRTKRNLDRGAGFTAFEADLSKPAHTLVQRYYKDGKECLIPQQGKNPRLLTPRECARLQGYPENFQPHPQKIQAYRQFGNSIALPVVRRIAEEIVLSLKEKK